MTIPSDSIASHLITVNDLTTEQILGLLDQAQAFRSTANDLSANRHQFRGRTVCNLFFEPSTRTRSSFQLAAQRLGADVLNFDVSTSSLKKGETALDTLKTIEAMGVDTFVIRHQEDGAVATLAQGVLPTTRVINAGDGRNSHPTQGLLDMLTIQLHKGHDFSRLKVALVGDVRHSRVARSDLQALHKLGAGSVRVCGPSNLLPDAQILHGCEVTQNLDEALDGVDVIMMLRLQRERMEERLINSLEAYHRDFGLTAIRLRVAAADAIVMHPGPMNRGIEIDGEVADGPASVILDQVRNGVFVRMAVLKTALMIQN